jgi:hypothetical protein
LETNSAPALPQPRPLWKRVFISPEEPRLRAAWRLLLQLIILAAFTILASFPIAILQLIGVEFAPFLMLAGQTATLVAITLSVFLARRFIDRRPVASLGLRLDLRAGWDVLVGIAIAGVMMASIYLIESLTGWLSFKGFAWQYQPMNEIAVFLLVWFVIFVIVGWQEELFSRGYQLQNIADGLNLTWGVVISSFIFAMLHQANPNFSWIAFIGLFAAGVFLAYGYTQSRQLWLPIGLHIGWNFFEGTIFGFPVSGLEMPTLILQRPQGPELVTGGAFGPEAGLIQLPALILGAILIYLYTRRRRQPVSP